MTLNILQQVSLCGRSRVHPSASARGTLGEQKPEHAGRMENYFIPKPSPKQSLLEALAARAESIWGINRAVVFVPDPRIAWQYILCQSVNCSPSIKQNFKIDPVKLGFAKAFTAFPVGEFHFKTVYNTLLAYDIHNCYFFIPVILPIYSKFGPQSQCIRYLV